MKVYRLELLNAEYDRIDSGLDSLPFLAGAANHPTLVFPLISAHKSIQIGDTLRVYTQRQDSTLAPEIPLRILSSMNTPEWEARGLALFTVEKI